MFSLCISSLLFFLRHVHALSSCCMLEVLGFTYYYANFVTSNSYYYIVYGDSKRG